MSAVAATTTPSDPGSEGAQVRPPEKWPFYFDVLHLDAPFIDQRYQRPLTNFWKEVRDDFKPAMVGTLVVAPRKSGRDGDRYAVIDGQTRMEAMRELGLLAAPCLVYPDLRREEEAKLFSDLQTKRRGMRTYDRFRAQLVAGATREGRKDPEVQRAVDIARVAQEGGSRSRPRRTPTRCAPSPRWRSSTPRARNT